MLEFEYENIGLIDTVLWNVCHTSDLFRYEIREMIQKIKILQGELRAGLYMQEVPNKSPHIARHELNNGRIMSDSSQGTHPSCEALSIILYSLLIRARCSIRL